MKIIHFIFSNGISGHEKGLIEYVINNNNKEIENIIYFFTDNIYLVDEFKKKQYPIEKKFVKIIKIKSFKFLSCLFISKKIIDKESFNIIHSHLTICDLVISLCKLIFHKSFFHISTRPFDYSYSKYTIIKYKILYSYICNKSINHQIFISDHVKKITNKYESFINKNFSTIYYGLKNKIIAKPKKRNKIILGMVGRLVNWKGHLIGIKIINDFYKKNYFKKDFELRLYGRGIEETKIKNFININSIKYIKLIDDIKNTDIIFDEIDILIHPSLNEGLGLVILEALQNGKPCVVSNRGAMKEIINHKHNGYIFTFDQEETLVKGIIYCVENYEYISKNNINEIKKFDINKMVIKYNELYSQYNVYD